MKEKKESQERAKELFRLTKMVTKFSQAHIIADKYTDPI